MELHFLGTGAGIPSKERNTSAIALRFLNEYRGTLWLFDCGEATQHQFLHSPLKLSRLSRIFITHLHGDHIYGLPGLLGSRSFQGGEEPLTVYGPKGIESYIDVTLRISQTHIRYPLTVVEVSDGLTLDTGNHTIHVKALDHGIESYGYRIDEKNKPGPLLVDRLKKLGVRPGPIYSALKQGKTVTLEDGRKLNGKDFIGSEQVGKKIVILGDTRRCKQALALAKDADVLVHEATFMEEDQNLAYDYYHSTSVDAAEIAKEANVHSLFITHISSRYQQKNAEMLLKEAKAIFQNTYLASDLVVFPI